MENGSGEGGYENRNRRKGILVCRAVSQEKGESDEQAEQQSCEEGVTVSAMEGEEGRRSREFAEGIDVRDSAGDKHGDGRGERGARERGAFQGVRGQGVGEGIHGGCYLTSGEASSCKRSRRNIKGRPFWSRVWVLAATPTERNALNG